MNRWGAGIGLVALAWLCPGGVAAQSSGAEVALAEVLYRQGRQLMADGKVSEACPKFAESYRLDAATGTLLNLAACHEAEHKLATAWLEYSEAVTLARRDKREDRIRFAQDRLASIEPKLSHLTVVVATDAETPELEIQVDKVAVRRAAWGVPAPVDPGSHTVEARASGRKAWTKEITVGQEPVNVTVTVPALEITPAATPMPALIEPSSVHATPDRSTRPIPNSVYVAGALTLGLTVGAVSTGVVYVSRRSQYLSSGSDADRDAARRWGLVNLPLTGGAIVGAAVTAYLFATRPEAPGPRVGRATVAPWIGAGTAGLVVEGSL
jgi:hypothetical protein